MKRYLPCDTKPPNSVTIPEIIGKYGDHPISVLYVIKTSPEINMYNKILRNLFVTNDIPDSHRDHNLRNFDFLNLVALVA